jgi:ankyrin repeat protein
MTSVDAFLQAAADDDADGALELVRADPDLAGTSLHVAAVLGLEDDVRRLLADGADAAAPAGDQPGDPLLWLCHSPFHGTRDDGLEAAARALLEAGADPNTRDRGRYALPALYAVTGRRNAPRVARVLLEAGADPTDGESVFHAAERFHEEALELLLEFGVDLNFRGDWGNTPLYFLLRHWDLAEGPDELRRGMRWLLDHGADPNVLCGSERESALHVATRRGQPLEVAQLLLDHGADVDARRGDGRTAWLLARHGGFDELADMLEAAGAQPTELGPADRLMAACGQGDADVTLVDPEHDSTPLGWAEFGRAMQLEPGGDYEACVAALVDAGA